MAHVDLNFLSLTATFTILLVSKLFADFKKALFYLALNAWLQLFFHIVEFQILALEVLKWVTFLFCI